MTKLAMFARRQQAILSCYGVAVLLFAVVSSLRPGFASANYLQILVVQAAVLGVVALGQTFVIISGGIDLSIPWTLNSAAMALTLLCPGSDAMLVIFIPVVLLGCVAVGLVNGLGVAYLGIHPMIMTLGMNAVLTGGLLGITHGAPGGMAPPAIEFLALGRFGPVPVVLIFWIGLTAIATIVLTFSALGRRIYAVGNNETVSLFSGVNVRVTRLIVYGISGLASGLGGILLAGRIGQSYLGMGDPFLFQSIAAVAIGGASILGGSGHYLGTVGGAFILTILIGLLPAFRLPASAQQIIYGVILILALILARGRKVEH